MGTSKVMIGLGVYAVIGLYALAFNTADQTVLNVGQSQAYHDQARQIANVGVKFAIGDAGSSTTPTLAATSVSVMNGNVTYTTDRPAGVSAAQMRVTSVGTYNSFSVTMVAILYYNGTKWILQRVYQQPDAAEYTRLS
ncbi:MAG TPA: hypothetical protein VMM58_11280 [Bacteroidota bacterium]|nr:hypothetical protein [Bacteroidota bacterium]